MAKRPKPAAAETRPAKRITMRARKGGRTVIEPNPETKESGDADKTASHPGED